MEKPKVVVIGTGMAAFGASHRLRAEGIQAVLYEKNSYHGGHTSTHYMDGFTFDEGPHVSFTKHERVRKLFSESVQGRFETVKPQINNYWQGYWIKHPAITNLYGLPAELLVKILQDFIEQKSAGEGEIQNYEDWLVRSYGRTYAETFPMQYTRKYHTTDAKNMTTEWVGPRLYQAQLEEVLLGAVSPHSPNIHYVQEYRYPSQDGFISYLNLFEKQATIFRNYQAVKIDPKKREVHFANEKITKYDHLISSVPLPELIPIITDAPKDVLEASNKLSCSSLVLVNIGIARTDVSAASWTYFYDENIPFSRISFPRNMSTSTVPAETSSIQCEVYFSKKYRPLDRAPEEYIDPVIKGLRTCGLIREEDKILLQKTMFVPYANIIFDLERPEALRIVHGYLDNIGIVYCGRYGDWGYLWTDGSFLSGENAAQRVLDKIAS